MVWELMSPIWVAGPRLVQTLLLPLTVCVSRQLESGVSQVLNSGTLTWDVGLLLDVDVSIRRF